MVVQHLMSSVKKVLGEECPTDTESDWQDQVGLLEQLMLENFTRQVRVESGDIAVIPKDGVKFAKYVTKGDDSERRIYLGLHDKSYDHQGLSVVVAFKPTLHEQPYHVHQLTAENTLAVHPTTGLGFSRFGAPATIFQLEPGEMIRYAPGTPHTMKNPTHMLSADASVKVPQALGDRTKLNHFTIGKYLSEPNRNPNILKPDPTKPFGEGSFRYDVTDLGYRYRVDFLRLKPGQELSHLDIGGIAQNTRGLMTVIPDIGNDGAQLAIERDGRREVSFGDWVVLGDRVDGLGVKNLGEKGVGVYLARQMD